eukprot:TRINITY_DN8380_c0_g1_i1.p1 TRINITY_DN8380_c0_g1~~TRINITY_DN8380_c0_g1_i1.p1  ORF type:complete len:195 (+),score=31.82 TRINITY_DN8380_c0_g1_i1:17-601(+)
MHYISSALFLLFLISAAFASSDQIGCKNTANCTVVATEADVTHKDGITSGCTDLPIFGQVCFEQDKTNDKTLIKVNDVSESILKIEPQVCLDDATLLEIIGKIPALANDSTIINDIYELFGCIPGGLFEVCLIYINDDCFDLDVSLLYFEQWCVYKSVTQFGDKCNKGGDRPHMLKKPNVIGKKPNFLAKKPLF